MFQYKSQLFAGRSNTIGDFIIYIGCGITEAGYASHNCQEN